MLVTDLKRAKRECERDIANAMEKFELNTGLRISDIDFRSVDITNLGTSERQYMGLVRIEVAL